MTRVQRRRTLRGLFHFRKFKFKSGTRKCTRATRRWRTAVENHNKVCKMRNANGRGARHENGQKTAGKGVVHRYTSDRRNRRRVSIFVRCPRQPPSGFVVSSFHPGLCVSRVFPLVYFFFFDAYPFLTGGRERASDFVRV